MITIKKLKIISLILALGLLFSVPSFAQEQEEEPILENNTLTLEQVRELAVENSRAAKDARLGLDYAGVKKDQVANQFFGVRDARREATVMGNPAKDLVIATTQNLGRLKAELAELEKNPESDPRRYAELKQLIALENSQLGVLSQLGGVQDLMAAEKQAEAGKLQAEDAYNATKVKVADAEKQIEFGAEGMYLQALLIEDTLKILEQNEDFMYRLLEVEKVKNEIGLSLETDTKTQAVTTSDSAKEWRYWNGKHENTLKVINDLIGRDLNEPLILTPVDIRISPRPQYDEVLEESIKNSGIIKEEKRKIERNQDDRGAYLSRSDEYDLYLKEEKQSRSAIEKVEVDNEVNLKNLFTELAAKEKAYQLSEITLENSEKILEQNKLKHEVGMISKIELEKAELEFQNKASDVKQAATEYYLALREIEMAKEGVFQ